MTVPLSSAATSFVGRVDELAKIAALLHDPACHLLTLTGPGGIGKTRLAIKAAQRFSGSVHFISLQPLTTPDFLVSTIADVLGFQFHSGDDAKQQLLDFLHEKSWLLVLDNFEHLLDGAILLSEILASASDVRLLVTSRERLNLREEWVLEVGGLAYPGGEHADVPERFDAVELFQLHARRVKTDFRLTDNNRPAVARICRLVGGMPLGIELAASWVRSLSCEAIADEIGRSLDILETPARNVEPRHRTMRAAFEPTWVRLSDPERAVFMKLSVFRGGFTRKAAEQVAGASLQTLTTLVDKSLLEVDATGRYDLHELLRHYGEEQLNNAQDADALRDAHSAFFAEFLRKQWQPLRTREQVTIVKEIEVEFDNIRTAWQTMSDRRSTTKLSMAVYSLWYFCNLRARAFDALALFRQAVDALRAAPSSEAAEPIVGLLLAFSGWFVNYGGSIAEARTLVNEGLMILRQVGSPEDIVLALYCLATVNAWDGNLPAMRQCGERMAQIAEDINDPWFLASALCPLAYAFSYSSDDLVEATRLAQAFSEAAERCGDTGLRAMSYLPVGEYIALQRGNYELAKHYCDQGLELWKALETSIMISLTYQQLGLIACRTNDYLLAALHFQQGLRHHVDAGQTQFAYDTLLCIAQLWTALGDGERAVELFTLVLPKPFLIPELHAAAEQSFSQLQAELPPARFAAAQERGRQRALGAVVQELIASLHAQVAAELSHRTQEPIRAADPTDPVTVTSPLSNRELDVLRLVAAGHTNQEIADQLVIGVSTVKKHINHIYAKLDVKTRTRAVARARDLRFLT